MTAPAAPRFLPLAAVTAAEAPLVGPPAVALGLALAAGEPVPAGFVLTNACLEAVLRPADLLEPWNAALSAARRGDFAPAEALAPRIADLTWPPDVAAAVAAAVDGLGERLSVKPATTHEAPEATDHPAEVNVPPADLPAAASRAWAALLAPEALTRLLAHGQDPAAAKAVLLVQVHATVRATGTLRTWDPAAPTPGGLHIAYRLPQTDDVAPAPVALHLPRRGRAGDLPGLAAGAGTRLRELALRNERRVGRPLDLAWAWTDAGPQLLDVRPVAGQAPGAHARPAVRWGRDLAAERFPEPISPLGWSALEPALRANFTDLEQRFGLAAAHPDEVARPLGAHIYANQALQTLTGSWSWRPAAHRPYLGAYLRKLAPLLLPTNWRDLRYVLAPRKGPLASGPCDPRLRIACGVFEAQVLTQAAVIQAQWAETFPKHIAEMAALAAEDPEAMDAAARVAYARRMIAANDAYMAPDLAINVILAACGWLVGAIAACVDGPEDPGLLAALAGGLDGHPTLGMNQALDQLTAAVAADSFLGAAMRHGDVAALRAAWRSSPARAVRADFLASYGHLGPSRDLREATWGERPEVLDGLVAARLRAGGGRAADPAEQAAAREAELERICLALAPAPWAVACFRRLVAALHSYMRLAEEHHLFAGRLIPAQRRLLAVWAQDLAERGVIARPDDIWFLQIDELLAAAGEAEPYTRAHLARRRRLAYEQALTHEAPAEFVGDVPAEATATVPRADGAIRGAGAGPGFVEGPVRHVRSLADLAAVRAGDVVVVEAAKPAFTPAWAIAGGVVAARGTTLSPGLVLARAYGLPAVTGLPDALRLLPEGTHVRVDGFAGTVTLVQPVALGAAT